MIEEPKCSKRQCVHYEGVVWVGETEATEQPACEAFPRGIPDEIAYGDNKHEKPVKGDRGIQFEKGE